MYNVNDCQLISLPKIHNAAGNITALENSVDLPFDVRRIYYLYDVPTGSERGGHAHYELEQYIVAVSGAFTFVLDDGHQKREVLLNNPGQALYIRKGIWREIKGFSSGSVCLVLASHKYTEADYIRDYQSYLNYIHHD